MRWWLGLLVAVFVWGGVKRKTILLKAGKQYLAKPRR
jgi:hypothetical protein